MYFFFAQLAGDRPEDTRATRRRTVGVDQNSGVLVELDVAAVSATNFLLDAHNDAAHDVTLFTAPFGIASFDAADDYVAQARVTALLSRPGP